MDRTAANMTDSHMMVLRHTYLHVHPPGEFVTDEMIRTKDFYEADVLDEILKRLATRPAGIIVDVGAMIGTHTVFLAKFAQYTAIQAFEPCRENFRILELNVDRFPNVHPHDVALSDGPQRVVMGFNPTNMGHVAVLETTQFHDPVSHGFIAGATDLDCFSFQNVSLIKIDVEGHEPQVLAGAAETIARCRPLIVMEDWDPPQNAQHLKGYHVAAEWFTKHQTFLFEPD